MNEELALLALPLLILTCFSLLFMFAVMINILLNFIFKKKIKEWYELIGNLISFIISIVFGVLIVKLASVKLFFVVCEIILISSILVYTNKNIIDKIYKNNRDVGKTLYKGEYIFVVNICIWIFYVATEVILQLYNLDLISISNSDILFALKANEAAILIVLSTEFVFKSIKTLMDVKKKQKNDTTNKQ